MRPDGYHGVHARAGFFEGWYVKLVSADRMVRLAVIPGIFLGADGLADRHDEAFVQVLDGVTGRSWYERYDAADFHAATNRFDVTIGPNRFNERGLTLDLEESGLRGQVQFSTAFGCSSTSNLSSVSAKAAISPKTASENKGVN